MTAPDTDTLAGLLARLRGQDPIPSRSEVADAIEALAAKDKARIERLEAALRLLAVRSESLVHAHRHGNGLEGWHNTVDGVDHAVTAARAALEGGE